MPLADTERAFADLLFNAAEALPFDADPARQRVYRRLVRSSLTGAITRSCPHARRIAGDAVLNAHIARFLEERPIKTRLVREIATEFGAFLEEKPAGAPRALVELVLWEVLEIGVIMAPDAPMVLGGPREDTRVEMHPSARLVAFTHPVHLVTATTTALPDARPAPTIVLAWREGENFTWKTIDGGLAKTLVALADGRTLGAAFDAVDAQERVDRGLVRADLVELHRRGAICAFTV